jgi:hypothetical protein
VEALCEVDAIVAQQLQCFAVLDSFSDGLLVKPVSDVDDRLDEVLVRRVRHEVADERDVDLQGANLKVL